MKRSPRASQTETWTGSGDGKLKSSPEMDVNLNDGTFNVVVPVTARSAGSLIRHRVTGYSQQPGGRTDFEPITSTTGFGGDPEGMVAPGRRLPFLRGRLPGSVGTLRVSDTFQAVLEMQGAETYVKRFPVAVDIEVSISPNPPVAEKLELIVACPGYETWVPEPRQARAVSATDRRTASRVAADTTMAAGEALEFTAQVKSTTGKTPKVKRMVFQLLDVSHEPGLCINVGGGTGPDLRLEPAPGARIEDNGQRAVYENPGPRRTALVGASDFGASGVLRVTALTEDEETLEATFAGHGKGDIPLPDRTAPSRIATSWKKQYGLLDLDDRFDDEKTPGNDHAGDGLTLYEQYRGVYAMVDGGLKHARLSPKEGKQWRKHLFVLVQDLPKPEAGFKLLESASKGIRVVQLAAGGVSPARVVNFASASRAGEQHGVILRPISDTSDEHAVGRTLPLRKLDLRPGTTEACEVDVPGIRAQWEEQKRATGTVPYTADEDVAQTIAHELSHALGLNHHGDIENSKPVGLDHDRITLEMERSNPGMYRAFGSDGVQLRLPVEIKGLCARQNGESWACGDLSCIMTYTSYYQWYVVQAPGRGYEFHATRPLPVGRTFCTGRDGNPPNAWFGPAAANRGNCLSRLVVKDY